MDRERGRPCPSERTRAVAGTAVVALIALVTAVGGGVVATGAVGADPASAAPVVTRAATALDLVSQSAWVAPDQSFDLTVRPSATAGPVSRLGLTLTVYSCLTSVSGFDQSVSAASPAGSVLASTHAALPLSGLTPGSGGTYSLAVPVVVGDRGAASGPFTIGLPASGSQCGSPSGVYPVRVQLVDTAGGQALGGFTTHLVYSDASSDTERLRFAVVLPITAAQTAASDPTPADLLAHPSDALAPIRESAVDAAAQTVARVAAHPGVALTLAVTPQTVVALRASGSAGAAAVSQLGDLATATPARDEFTWAPYVPVDAGALVASGLDSELALQVSRGSQVLADQIEHEDGPPGPGAGGLGAWVTDDAVDAATVTQLHTAGYTQLVLPASAVAGAPANGSSSEPFLLPAGPGTSMTAVASDADVDSRFLGSPGDPVLAAHQLVAELAQIYYEKPNDDTPRAVVAVAPSSWTDDPAFVEALLTSLTDNPILEPVTVNTVLTTLPTAPCRSTCRTVAASGSAGLPVGAIRTQRQRVDGFATAAPTAATVATQLGDLILAGESELLRPDQQTRLVHAAGRSLDVQLGQFAVSGDRTVTLTSQQGTLPVDIESSAGFPATASLTVTSDKLLFPNGASQWTRPGSVPIHPGTNIIDVPVTARSSGQFTVDVTLRSADGSLVLSQGEISVRSTATSVVGVVLSLGALAVLAVWWFRTSRKRRATRRRDEAATDPSPETR